MLPHQVDNDLKASDLDFAEKVSKKLIINWPISYDGHESKNPSIVTGLA